jgi:hypothetical protein
MTAVFSVGEVVQSVGLASKKSLNGAKGTIVGDSDYECRGRFHVFLQSPTVASA